MCDYPEMKIVLLRAEVGCQQRDHPFRAASAKMRDEQKKPGPERHGFECMQCQYRLSDEESCDASHSQDKSRLLYAVSCIQ